MSSTPPTQELPGEGSESDAGSNNTPLTIPYFFALGLGGGLGAGIGFGVVMTVMEMMTK